MTDDKAERARRDTNNVSLKDEFEIRYWTGRCEVDEATLVEAVEAAGTGVQAVQSYLDKQKKLFSTQQKGQQKGPGALSNAGARLPAAQPVEW